MAVTNLFVFGDSLPDTGNSFAFTGGLIPPSPPYYQGRFSNGPIAVETLVNKLGSDFVLDPANNYAFGGATTGRSNSNEDDIGADLPGLLDQIDAFTAKVGATGADSTGLYIVWAGPNNFLDALGGSIAADPADLLQQGTIDLTNTAKTLSNLGAKQLVFPNMVNLGRLPATQKFATEATAITKAFNASVALAFGNLPFTVTGVDLFSVGEAIATNPGSFGFSNVTVPLLPLQLSPTPPSNPQEFFFWDQYHPTTQGHAVFGNTLYQTLTGGIPPASFKNITGTPKRDVLTGTAANDNIDGLGGRDQLNGDKGDDRIEGWSGKDQVSGDRGNDVVSGGDGDDLVSGNQGNDIGFGGDGDDEMSGDTGDDILVGDEGNDQINAGSGNDYLLGGSDRDILLCGAGADIANGGSGSDISFGGGGKDQLNGGTGRDRLTGNQGSDQFVYRSGNGKDRITDFTVDQDKIDLSSFRFSSFDSFTSSVSFNRDTISFGNGDTLQLDRIRVANLTADQFILG